MNGLLYKVYKQSQKYFNNYRLQLPLPLSLITVVTAGDVSSLPSSPDVVSLRIQIIGALAIVHYIGLHSGVQ